MSNQGIYREAGHAGGLPLPRAYLLPLTIVVALIALLAIAMSPSLLAVPGRGMAGAWRIFRDGGASMWLILFANVTLPIVLALLGAFALRGRRVPSGLLFVVAALPLAVALLGAWGGQRTTLRAISGESVDPEQKARILAEGVAETMSCDVFGGFVTCGLALLAAVALASALASIDSGAATRGGTKPSGLGAIGAAGAGAVWFLATLGLGVVRVRQAGALVFLPAMPILVLVPFAALAGRGASVLRAWHDRREASRAAAALFVAALCAILAVLALQRAIEASFASRALEAIAGETVDESQRATILASAVAAGKLAPAAYAVHVIFGVAMFGIALGGGASPFTPSVAIACAAGLALVGGAFGLSHARTSAPKAMAEASRSRIPAGLTLPVVVDTFSHKGEGGAYGEEVVVMKDGSGPADPNAPSTCYETHHVTLYADRAATMATVSGRVRRDPKCPIQLAIVAEREHRPEIEALLGDLAPYLGHTAYISARLDDGSPARSDDVLRVRSVADDAIEIDGVRVTLPLHGDMTGAGLGSRVSHIHYTFRPNDTVDHVVQAITATETIHRARLYAWSLERVLEIDDGKKAAPEEPLGGALGGLGGLGAGTARPGAASVNGRLPPEVIQRIVRQNNGRFRLCYENGLRKNPDLKGRVVVKFVIDRSGAVSTVQDGGSDLPDQGVVSCVVRSFGNLTFPQPEGGIVTVVYPIIFTPAS
jgi:hypothetical protein